MWASSTGLAMGANCVLLHLEYGSVGGRAVTVSTEEGKMVYLSEGMGRMLALKSMNGLFER